MVGIILVLGGMMWYGYQSVVANSGNSVTDQPNSSAQPAVVFPKLSFRYPNDTTTTKSPSNTPTKASAAATTPKPIWSVPILMYHYVRTVDASADPLGFRLSVTHEQFSQQLDWLQSQGYHTIDPSELLQSKPLPAKSVLITFDDGYEDFYTDAWPVLKTHDFGAMLFVVTGFFGKSEYVTKAQVAELSNQSVIIGAHTILHVNLTTQTPEKLQQELVTPKADLQKIIDRPVPWVAYPSGKYDDTVLAATKAAGYTFGVTTHFGLATNLDSPLAFHRIEILGSDPMEDFQLKVQGILPKHTSNQ